MAIENAGTDFVTPDGDAFFRGPIVPVEDSPRRLDEKGRVIPEDMSVPEMMREILANQREVKDMVERFMVDMQNNPMLKMMGKFGK